MFENTVEPHVVRTEKGARVNAPLESFTFKLSFWNRIKLFFGYSIEVAFSPPLTGHHSISVGKVVKSKGDTVSESSPS